MREKINEEVGVVMYHSAHQRAAHPHRMNWQDKDYLIDKFGYHNSVCDGRAWHHPYESGLKSLSLWKRLHVNTERLDWRGEGSSDGNAA